VALLNPIPYIPDDDDHDPVWDRPLNRGDAGSCLLVLIPLLLFWALVVWIVVTR